MQAVVAITQVLGLAVALASTIAATATIARRIRSGTVTPWVLDRHAAHCRRAAAATAVVALAALAGAAVAQGLDRRPMLLLALLVVATLNRALFRLELAPQIEHEIAFAPRLRERTAAHVMASAAVNLAALYGALSLWLAVHAPLPPVAASVLYLPVLVLALGIAGGFASRVLTRPGLHLDDRLREIIRPSPAMVRARIAAAVPALRD